jgi:hypothetical protein
MNNPSRQSREIQYPLLPGSPSGFPIRGCDWYIKGEGSRRNSFTPLAPMHPTWLR